MGGLAEIASTILSQSARSVEVSAQNISNMSTPGYKRRVSFSHVLATSELNNSLEMAEDSATDFAQGKMVNSGNPFDLAITGPGFFEVSSPSQNLTYTRQGQFTRDGQGHLVNATGGRLQVEGGGDLVLKGRDFKLAEDGVILEDGQPTARLEVMNFIDPSTATRSYGAGFAAMSSAVSPVANPTVRQGATEAANVSAGDEMVAMMAALRRAEGGQKLMNVYDDLMGRAITVFGQ